MNEDIRIIFSGTLVHSNNFRLGFFPASSDAWFAQNKFLTELNSPVPGVHFSFATIFQYLNFVPFRLYSNFELSHGFSYNGENRLSIFFICEK